MSKKGFSLVELLAVIVILGVVMTIGSISIATVRQKIDKNMFENKIEFVIQAGKNWGNNNKAELIEAGNVKEMTIADLIADGVLKTEELEVKDESSYICGKEIEKDGKKFCHVITNSIDGSVVNNLKIKIHMKHNRVYACIVNNSDNWAILNDNAAHDEYGHLNYYCA